MNALPRYAGGLRAFSYLASAKLQTRLGPACDNHPPKWFAMLRSLPRARSNGEAPDFSAPQPPGALTDGPGHLPNKKRHG